MSYKSFTLLLILCLLFSCKKKKASDYDLFNNIYTLHKKIDTISKDSMKIYLKKTKKIFLKKPFYPDSLKAENSFLIGKYFDKSNNLDSTLFYYNKAIEYDTDSLVSDREFNYYYRLILKYYNTSNYANALTITELITSKLSQDINNEKLGLIFYTKAMIFMKLKEYKKSLENNIISTNYYIKTNNYLALNTIISNKSRIYYALNKKDSAKVILINLLKNKPLSFNNKYQIYNQLGVYYFYENNFNKANKSYINALKNAKKLNLKFNKNYLANCYNNIAEVYLKLEKFDFVKKYLDSTFLLGIKNIKENRIRNAQKYKLQLLFKTKKNIQPVLSYLDSMQNTNEQNYKKQMNNEFLALTKSLKNEQLVLIQKQQSELKNSQLKKNQLILLFTLLILIMSIFIGILHFRQKKIQYNRDEILMQQRLFRAQMNPHFTSNILYSIQNLFETDIDTANKYLIKFSRLLRLNLENSIENYVAILKEIEAVEKYLELQILRFPNKFNYQILGNCIKDELLYIPPMLIQPFVENVIEHAFKNINYKGLIEIILNIKDNFIFCEIIDNGIGISPKKHDVNKQSTSTELIKKLIKKLTNKDVLIKNNTTKTGTRVQFYIPYKKE